MVAETSRPSLACLERAGRQERRGAARADNPPQHAAVMTMMAVDCGGPTVQRHPRRWVVGLCAAGRRGRRQPRALCPTAGAAAPGSHRRPAAPTSPHPVPSRPIPSHHIPQAVAGTPRRRASGRGEAGVPHPRPPTHARADPGSKGLGPARPAHLLEARAGLRIDRSIPYTYG
eukprot:scaffold115_cov304-Prasinococcus_capsulatus_cf.AAC.37